MSKYCEACGLTACYSLAIVPCKIRADYLKGLAEDNRELSRLLSDREGELARVRTALFGG